MEEATAVDLSDEINDQIVQLVASYWIKRRKSQTNPLNYRFIVNHFLNNDLFQRAPDPDDPSPYKAFRSRTEESYGRKRVRKNDNSSYWKMKQLRVSIEKARLILEMMIKREQHKQKSLNLYQEMVSNLLLLPAETALPFLVYRKTKIFFTILATNSRRIRTRNRNRIRISSSR